MKTFTCRAILAPRNDEAEEIYTLIVQRFPGTEYEYRSIDSVAIEDGTYYSTEFLNSVNPSGIPPHRLVLKIRSPVIMLRNLNPNKGLCNRTRLIFRQFSLHVIHAEIVNGSRAGTHEFIPCIE